MHVLLAVDGTEVSAKASSFLSALLGGQRHQVTSLSVAVVPLTFAPLAPGVSSTGPASPALAWAPAHPGTQKQALADAKERAGEQGPPNADVQARLGDPAREILHVADEIDADLIVVGTHDPGLIERLLQGSVSKTVLRESDRPVLLVR
jgi:nucleotide-binding universal stress UspA family protein